MECPRCLKPMRVVGRVENITVYRCKDPDCDNIVVKETEEEPPDWNAVEPYENKDFNCLNNPWR